MNIATPTMPADPALDNECINTLRFLCVDAVQKADSGHPGMPMDAAAMAYALWTGDLSKVGSVASIFVSRIDVATDKRLDKLGDKKLADRLRGKAGIANAKIAYARYKALFSGPRWGRLADLDAQPQRLLWASTSTKNPAYKDTLYVEALIGRHTVDTIPPATMDAFRDHGQVTPDAIEQNVEAARATLAELEKHRVSLKEVTDELVKDGVQQFADAFDKLFGTIAKRRRTLLEGGHPRLEVRPGSPEMEPAVEDEMAAWSKGGRIRRLWAGDKALWTGTDEDKWVGWLHIIEQELAGLDQLRNLAEQVTQGGYGDVVLLGMGGSSLGPEVLAQTIGPQAGWPRFHMLDSTDQGRGLIPLAGEPLTVPECYGTDRFFAYLELDGQFDPAQRRAVEALERASHPVARIRVKDVWHIGQEFFRWEIATAVAGSIIGIDPFNQPDVEASKDKTRALTDAYEKSHRLPEDAPLFRDNGIAVYADPRNAAELGRHNTLVGYLKRHFGRVHAGGKSGDYVALLAYIERNASHTRALTAMRARIRDKTRAAACLGFGPRFQHSTGQAYKGGPNSGVFLQVTCDDPADIDVPAHSYSFGVVKAAQASGDLAVLVGRDRRALRVHLTDVDSGLEELSRAVDAALE